MSKIDVIIPIKYRPHLLKERSLPSLLRQTFQDFKVTVVVDGSTFGDHQIIEAIAKAFSGRGLDISIMKNRGAAGAAGARNYGLSITDCPYVLWFDSDDILLPNKLEASLKLLEAGDYDFAITRAQHIRDGELLDEFWGEPQAPNRKKYEFHFPFQTMCALFNRSFITANSITWNEDLNMTQDWEISNQSLLRSSNWVYSPLITAHYFVPSASSGSIGSQLTKQKISSQLRALNEIQHVLQSKGLTYSLVSRIRVLRHKLFLKIASKGRTSSNS